MDNQPNENEPLVNEHEPPMNENEAVFVNGNVFVGQPNINFLGRVFKLTSDNPCDFAVAQGHFSGHSLTHGHNDIFLGYGAGYNVTHLDDSILIGTRSDAEHHVRCSIGIGTCAKILHNHAIVLGDHVESSEDYSITIGTPEYETLHIGSLHVQKDTLTLADNNFALYTNNTDTHVKCGACMYPMTSGLEWTYDAPANCTLCFQCIFECVLQYKATERWNQRRGVHHTSETLQPSSTKENKTFEKTQSREDRLLALEQQALTLLQEIHKLRSEK